MTGGETIVTTTAWGFLLPVRREEAPSLHMTTEDAERWIASLQPDDDVLKVPRRYRLAVVVAFLAGAEEGFQRVLRVAVEAAETERSTEWGYRKPKATRKAGQGIRKEPHG